MGKGRPRAVETGVVGHCLSSSGSGSLNLPQAPVFYPTEEEFKDPLRFIAKIRSEAEPFGICRIVPPKCWKPPFALDLQSFTFPTKCQAIHHLQARPAACDPETFELEYDRFLKNRGGKRSKKRPIFQAEELDLCKLFNTVKRYGGYEKVVKEKKWGDVFQIVCSVGKISTCSKHVLCQLYRDHLFDYEEYHNCLNGGKRAKKCKRTMCRPRRNEGKSVGSISGSKRKRGAENSSGERRKEHDLDEEGDRDQICEQCKSGLHGEVMLLCDRCDRGWHLHCLSPPLECVPSGNWYCLECINSNKDSFGFVPGKHFSLEAFRRLADRAKRKWFGSAQVTRSQIEKRFWEIVEGSTGEVEVMYGSDLDTSLFGSGFPRTHDPIPSSAEVEIWKEYCSSPWNLNNLPKLQGSMLQAVHDNIAGVIVPWLYVGMLFSSFCWHVEDHCFYSMNYLHWGEPKCWYSVPGGEARAFEQVMRNTLPDLFEAQPDLLFQLVTMLNPSVLQENGVPVYSVLQEPGNFVITFPRAFHGGFNFGLNCAEAVNFAPADWLPHGGFGAEQYRLYHKAAVLSHEELLCVVAKSGCSNEALPYLMEEMLRIISKERTYREKLWRSGIVKSSRMPPRNHPEYVGTEEDPTCIICQQYLYLSAVICSCRPSAFVCLEHWEHLCECNPNQLRLLYRHNLAELDDLVPLGGHTLTMGQSLEKTIRTHSRACRRQVSFSNKSNTLTKKVNGSFATHTQLAEDWLVSSLNIFEIPFSEDASISALNEAEQFLWAGREMDPVRNMAKNLVEAQKWAADVRDCLSKVEAWLHLRNSALEKVSLAHVQNLLSFDTAPCVEPGHPKLKVYAEEAQKLDAEIRSSLSSHSCVGISELEVLYSRALELPIDLEESQRLASNISCAKVWVESVNKYLGDGRQLATPIDIDDLYKLKSQMLELHVQLPEMELLTDLLRQVESWQFRSSETLRGPINLKELELILRDADNFIVMTPEMKVLKQYHSDALSWKCRCHDVLENICEREDHGNVVEDLTCLLKAGNSLRVQVEELLLVETELRKSICRERASKAYSVRMPLEFIQQIRAEAVLLKLENEKIFIDIFGTLGAAISWEERAKHVLESSGPMSEFEDVIRKSEEIFAILPSLDNVNNVVSNAKSWIERSEPFLLFAGCAQRACSTLLKVDALKELISQSKLLKVSLKEPEILQLFLNNVEGWQHDACPLLEHTSILFNMDNKDSAMNDGLKIRIEELLARIKFVTDAGISLGFDLREIPELKNASSALDWSLKALSFCFSTPSLKEVESLIEDAVKIPNTFVNSALVGALIEGAIWLKKALVLVLEHHHPRRCKLKDVEEVLDEAQRVKLLYPMKVSQLVIAVEKHKYWQEQVHLFFESQSGGQSWSSLLQLKELGDSHAFDCPELDKIAFEVEKIDRWMLRCKYIVGLSIGGPIPLVTALVKIKDSLDRALCIYSSSSFEDKELIVCLKCKGRYRLSCMVTSWATADLGRGYKCPFCRFVEIEDSNEELPLISRRNRPKLQTLIELLSDARGFYSGIKEQDLLQEIVERALACKSYLTETVNCALSYRDEDLCFISESILIALKAAEVVGVYDYQNSFKLKLALTRQAWKIRVKKLLEATEKPLLQQIQCILKEGLAIHISSEDYFVMKLREVKHICQQWASNAKKVATDSGALELNSVFQLITEGENLPVHFEKELELLKARSVLYCICRKPYDQRPMIACDQCNEWYHFECINIREPPPKDFLCPACDPPQAEYLSLSVSMHRDERMSVDWASQTPPQETESKCRQRTSKSNSSLKKKMLVGSEPSTTDKSGYLNYGELDHLWRKNRRPFRRRARKSSKLESFSLFLHSQR